MPSSALPNESTIAQFDRIEPSHRTLLSLARDPTSNTASTSAFPAKNTADAALTVTDSEPVLPIAQHRGMSVRRQIRESPALTPATRDPNPRTPAPRQARTYSQATSSLAGPHIVRPSKCFFAEHEDQDTDRSELVATQNQDRPHDLLTFSNALAILARTPENRSEQDVGLHQRARTLIHTCAPLVHDENVPSGLPRKLMTISSLTFAPAEGKRFTNATVVRNVLCKAARELRLDMPAHLLVCDVVPGMTSIFFVKSQEPTIRRILQQLKSVYDGLRLSPLPFEDLLRRPALGSVVNSCLRIAQTAWGAVCMPPHKTYVPAHVRAALAAGALNAVSKVLTRLPMRAQNVRQLKAFLVRITSAPHLPSVPAPRGAPSKPRLNPLTHVQFLIATPVKTTGTTLASPRREQHPQKGPELSPPDSRPTPVPRGITHTNGRSHQSAALRVQEDSRPEIDAPRLQEANKADSTVEPSEQTDPTEVHSRLLTVPTSSPQEPQVTLHPTQPIHGGIMKRLFESEEHLGTTPSVLPYTPVARVRPHTPSSKTLIKRSHKAGRNAPISIPQPHGEGVKQSRLKLRPRKNTRHRLTGITPGIRSAPQTPSGSMKKQAAAHIRPSKGDFPSLMTPVPIIQLAPSPPHELETQGTVAHNRDDDDESVMAEEEDFEVLDPVSPHPTDTQSPRPEFPGFLDPTLPSGQHKMGNDLRRDVPVVGKGIQNQGSSVAKISLSQLQISSPQTRTQITTEIPSARTATPPTAHLDTRASLMPTRKERSASEGTVFTPRETEPDRATLSQLCLNTQEQGPGTSPREIGNERTTSEPRRRFSNGLPATNARDCRA